EVLEHEPARIERRQLLDRAAAALARRLHGRQQLGDRLALLGPHDRRRLAAPFDVGERRKARDGGRGPRQRPPRSPPPPRLFVVSLPVVTSAIVRWSMISPTDQSFSPGFQFVCACESPSTSRRTCAREASRSFHSCWTAAGRVMTRSFRSVEYTLRPHAPMRR